MRIPHAAFALVSLSLLAGWGGPSDEDSVKLDGDRGVAHGEPKGLFDGGQAVRKVDGEWLIDE